jgi:hypothetical protein
MLTIPSSSDDNYPVVSGKQFPFMLQLRGQEKVYLNLYSDLLTSACNPDQSAASTKEEVMEEPSQQQQQQAFRNTPYLLRVDEINVMLSSYGRHNNPTRVCHGFMHVARCGAVYPASIDVASDWIV